MSGSSPDSVRLAVGFRATIGLLRITDFESAREMRDLYTELSRKDGWEPGPEHFMVCMPCSIADTVDEAMETLRSGTRYFLGVLGGGIRTAQRLVLQKTRHYREEAHR